MSPKQYYFLIIHEQILNSPIHPFNPISRGHGSIWPGHHTLVCCVHMNRARITKIDDFVSLTIWLVPVKPFLKYIFQNLWKTEIWNFLGSSSMSRKLKKKNDFLKIFCSDSYFFVAESLFHVFSASFEVYNSFETQNMNFWWFLAWKMSILTILI